MALTSRTSFSGTFPVANQTIGFIRITSIAPFDEAHALQQFQGEITFFQDNTGDIVSTVFDERDWKEESE